MRGIIVLSRYRKYSQNNWKSMILAKLSWFRLCDDWVFCSFCPGVLFQALSLIYFFHLNVWWSLKGCNGKDDGCCTTTEPCQEGFGDCDSDDQCAGDLRCGRDNCDRFELHKNGVCSLYFPVLSCILRYVACKSIAGWTIATGLNLFDKKIANIKITLAIPK